MGTAGLTERQREVFEFIMDRQRQDTSIPTVREIARHFGFSSPNAAAQHLRLIEKKGYIRLLKGRARGIVVPVRAAEEGWRGIRAPLVGTVAAGRPITATENLEGHITLDRNLFSGDEVFALRVRGDSMIGVGIHDGDIAVIRRQPVAEEGQIVVLLIDGEATLKRFIRDGQNIILRAENPGFADIVIGPDEAMVEVIGKVIGIIRTMG
jgi:repressor LexA